MKSCTCEFKSSLCLPELTIGTYCALQSWPIAVEYYIKQLFWDCNMATYLSSLLLYCILNIYSKPTIQCLFQQLRLSSLAIRRKNSNWFFSNEILYPVQLTLTNTLYLLTSIFLLDRVSDKNKIFPFCTCQ